MSLSSLLKARLENPQRMPANPIESIPMVEAKPALRLYLSMFLLNPEILYENYMENLSLIVDWLGLPSVEGIDGEVPRLFHSYEIQELAKTLRVSQYEIYLEAISLVGERRKAG